MPWDIETDRNIRRALKRRRKTGDRLEIELVPDEMHWCENCVQYSIGRAVVFNGQGVVADLFACALCDLSYLADD